ncbi:lysylphosphatidylglycerol synthase transmembrane domain-containing protein [Croceiramulus getboli]|nr:lysylphosphatidylglycerol synthase transmembrane domain-containing protein [Flavobacteriaceae bacterium YJPT1-3]
MQKKQLIKLLKTILPLALGVFLIWYSLQSATPAERRELWTNIKEANPLYIALSLLFGVLSHASRAYRWKYLLQPLGYRPRFANSFMAVMAAYLANLGIPRSGELLRAATISTYEEVPFEKAFGTIIVERLADFCMLLLVIAIALGLQSENLLNYMREQQINPLITLGVLIGFLLMLWIAVRIIRNSKNRVLVKVRGFVIGLVEGMRSILQMKNKGAFIFHTFFIWGMYVLMFWIVKFTVPETANASWGAVLSAFVVGSFAISATNGGIGVYPVAIGALLLVFDIPKQAGEAYGWIIWGSQTALVIVLGALSFLLLPLYNRRS